MFKNLTVIFFALSLSLQASAIDLFELKPAQGNLRAGSSNYSFSATLNSQASEASSVVVNLPGKRILAKKMATAGSEEHPVIPYAFQDQNGSVMLHSSNGTLQEVIVFDEQEKQVFKGKPQRDGQIHFEEIDIDTFICDDYVTDTNNNSGLTASDIDYYQGLDSLTLQQVSSLQSRPGASKVLYIDYFAGSVSGTAWQSGATINYENYSFDGDANAFSLIDLQSMYAAWAETAEDYAQFDINVTTDASVYDLVTNRNRSKIIATSTNWRGSGGVAYVNVFGRRNDDFYNIGWTFNRSFGSMGMTHSHEAGHQMGLSHDGEGSSEYYSGHGDYGPIMGAPFGKTFVQWSDGVYPNATQTQDDIAIIAGKLGILADDHGGTNGSASLLSSNDVVGIISPSVSNPDTDVFSFTLDSSHNPEITVRSLFQQRTVRSTAGGLNLSAIITLSDSLGNVVSQKIPSNIPQNNDFVFSQQLSAGTYYLSIENSSYNTSLSAGFNEYGNSGYYQILSNLGDQPSPDLVVNSMAVNDTDLEPSEVFTASVTVSNQGLAASQATTLRYYRSTDSIISIADTQLEIDDIDVLAAAEQSPESVSLSAPSIEDTYYIGACVDPVLSETDTGNNCSSGVEVTVSVPVFPDLVVDLPVVSDASLEIGQSFNISVTTRNQGSGSSVSTTLKYFLSSDEVISAADTQIDSDSVSSLIAGGSEADDSTNTAPAVAGNYYIGACVDSVSGESNLANNCSTGAQIVVLNLTGSGDDYEPDNMSGEARLIVKSEMQLHSFHVVGDKDWLSFSLSEAVSNFELETSLAGAAGDTRLYLYDEGLAQIAFNDNGGDGSFSLIELSSLPAGRYYILVDEFGNDGTLDGYNLQMRYSADESDQDDILDFLPAIINAARKRASLE